MGRIAGNRDGSVREFQRVAPGWHAGRFVPHNSQRVILLTPRFSAGKTIPPGVTRFVRGMPAIQPVSAETFSICSCPPWCTSPSWYHQFCPWKSNFLSPPQAAEKIRGQGETEGAVWL
jgi:hypothetical protein